MVIYEPEFILFNCFNFPLYKIIFISGRTLYLIMINAMINISISTFDHRIIS